MATDPHPEAMTTTSSALPSTPAGPTTSRRNLLRAGGLGVFAAAFLAACGDDKPDEGVSGLDATTTLVPPTVPVTEPNSIALADDVVQLRTMQSVELFVSGVYGAYGPKLSDSALRAAAFRFQTDHAQIADVFGDENGGDAEAAKSNVFLEENLLAPARSSLNADGPILEFLAGLESALAASYINATGVFTGADWRQRAMTFGAASARRLAVLGDPDQGLAPTEALFPLDDLIPGEAYLGTPDEEAEGS